jgi:hypothetical protein
MKPKANDIIKAALLSTAVAIIAGCVPYTADSCRPVIGQTTPQQLRAMCGPPEHINRTRLSSGTHEQWRYGGYPYTMLPVHYYYFDNGVLTAIQD